MSGNTFGRLFKVTTFGESHGPAIGAIVDGCPAGLVLSEADIQPLLDRRRPGQSKMTTQRREPDQVTILSGTFDGVTTGTPIALQITNLDAKSKDYHEIKDKFRPGHADYTYQQKYGIRDHRGGGRASARETAMRVAAGAIASKFLNEKLGIGIQGYLSQMGEIAIDFDSFAYVNDNPFFCPNQHQVTALSDAIEAIRKQGDSLGAKVTVVAENVPSGLGEPVFDKLDAMLAYALMSLPAAKAVEIGSGVDAAKQKGSEHRDQMDETGFLSNDAGGMLGGISTGMPVVATTTFKPTSSIITPAKTIDTRGNPCEIVTKGRHDPCVGIRAVPIVEAMLALVLMDAYLRHYQQC